MLLRAWNALVDHHYDTQSTADEMHRVRCSDGVVVVVKRFRPRRPDPSRQPILCIPGLGADSSNFDAPAPYGLGRVFADAGHDTWVIDLRGTGLSTMSFSSWMPVCFDDFVGLDLPAAIEHICQTTHAPQVTLVGHSMGGIAAYAVVGSGAGSRVGGVVAIAAPLGFPTGLDVAPFFKLLLPLSPFVPGLFGGTLGRLITPFSLRMDVPFLKNWVLLDNVDAKVLRRVYHRAVQDVPRGLMHQFQDWVVNDVIRSKDRVVDYRSRVNGCITPTFVVEAPADGLAETTAVRRALSLLKHTEHWIAGKAGGCSVDYGHIDVVFGREAPAEVHPRLLDWLERHARTTTTAKATAASLVRAA